MKHLILAVLIFTAFNSMAQESVLNNLFDKYSGKEGYTSIYITSYMFELLASIDEEDKDLQSAAQGIQSIKMLTVNTESGITGIDAFYSEVLAALPNTSYKDLMVVKDGTQEITFKVREKDKKITELVMLVKDAKEPLLMFIEGNIDLKSLAKMSKSVDIEGFEHLEKVDDQTK